MLEQDLEFFEKYKKLDAICSDMLSCKNGVSEYINRMESKGLDGFKQISDWDDRYRTLKHLRWVRNRIAHESTEDEPVCKPQDILLLNEIYDLVIGGNDPLTLLAKEKSKAKKPANKSAAANKKSIPIAHEAQNKGESVGTGIAVVLGLAVAIIILICLITK